MSRILLALAVLTTPLAASAGWQEDLAAAVNACATAPEPCDAIDAMRAYPARNGDLRFRAVPAVEDPATHPILLDRLMKATDPALRSAYADLAARALLTTDPQWYPAWAELAATDPDARVRKPLIVGLRRAPYEAAGPGLTAAARHTDPETRALALREMGGHTEAIRFVPVLRAAVTDPSAQVRAAVAQALGWAGDQAALADLQAMTTDVDPEVRAHALLAVRRLDADRARQLAQGMQSDEHPRVRAAVARALR